MNHVTKCDHGVPMNVPCRHCDSSPADKPERPGPHDPKWWTISKTPPCAAHGGE